MGAVAAATPSTAAMFFLGTTSFFYFFSVDCIKISGCGKGVERCVVAGKNRKSTSITGP